MNPRDRTVSTGKVHLRLENGKLACVLRRFYVVASVTRIDGVTTDREKVNCKACIAVIADEVAAALVDEPCQACGHMRSMHLVHPQSGPYCTGQPPPLRNCPCRVFVEKST